jgi:cytochrome c oxidase subunit II
MFQSLPLWPQRASSMAGRVDALFIFLLVLCGFMCVSIFIMILVFAARYRRTKTRQAEQIEGSNALELTWTGVPLLIFLGIFIWGAILYFMERTPPDDSAEIYTVAKQWMWKFQHLEGQREINELHVPVGRDVKMIMTSQDVIHSFYVPAFRIKQDVLPGRYTVAWFKATKAGTYHLFCAEYCGTAHSGMIGEVVVMDPAAYEQWLSGGPAAPLTETGKQLFMSLGCSTCHRFDTQGRGPNLMALYGQPVNLEDGRTVIADDNYIRESILAPAAKVVAGFKPIMPTFQGIVSEEQVNALLAYIKSLHQTPQGTVGTRNTPASPPPGQPQNLQVQ